ncbi:MAG: ATP-binding protein [Hornefia sp.]|nr:ATP-binding protein [Hornefia sp.]
MKYIHRDAELLIKKAKSTFKTILVTGARQTGKSTMMKKLYPEQRILSFDDPFLEEQAKNDPEFFLSLYESPVTLDEIQYVPSLFRNIKNRVDKSDNKGEYFLTGSQPFKLMEMASDSLAGRVYIVELPPLSMREIQECEFNMPFKPTIEYIQKRKHSAKAPENLWKMIHRGGYPELQNNEVDWQMFFAGYVKTYLERDVRALAAVQNLDDFRKFMVACAARTGQMVNYSNIADEISRSADTVKKWVSILESSGIIYLLEPYSSNSLNRAIKTPKLYFRDTGLACYLTRWLTPETLANGNMSGNMFETFVISEILKSYSNAGVDYRYCVSYYRGKDKKKIKDGSQERQIESEIDFIIEENGVLYPIEIKKTELPKANMTGAFQILDNIEERKRGTGAVICTCTSPGILRENVLAIPAWYV